MSHTAASVQLHYRVAAGCRPVVAPGDQLRPGDLLIDADRSAAVRQRTALAAQVVAATPSMVIIEADTASGPPPALASRCDLDSRAACAERLRDCGVVGMGGAGFATHRKLLALPEPLDLVLINAVECDPWLEADLTLARAAPDQVRAAVDTLQRLLRPARLLVATGPRTDPVLQAIDPGIDRLVTAGTYTSGWEPRLLARAGIRNSGGTAAAASVFAVNLATAVAIQDSLLSGQPLARRYVTINGATTQRVWIGTPARELLDAPTNATPDAPIDTEADPSGPLILGGTMGSRHTAGAIIDPTIAGLRRAPADSLSSPCIRCGDCRPACPVGLNPDELFRGRSMPATQLQACIRCGACDLVCPSQLPLAQTIGAHQQAEGQQQAITGRAQRAADRHAARTQRQRQAQDQTSGGRQARLTRLRQRQRPR